MMGKPTGTVVLSLWSSQTVDPQLGRFHGTKADPLNLGDSCAAWFLVGSLAVGTICGA